MKKVMCEKNWTLRHFKLYELDTEDEIGHNIKN